MSNETETSLNSLAQEKVQGSHEELMKDNAYYIDLQTNNYSSSHKKMEEPIILNENIMEQE